MRSQDIRHELLLQLYGSRSLPHTAEYYAKVAKRQGFDYAVTEVRDELAFLVGQGFAEPIEDPGTGQVQYRITSKGVIYWETREA